MCRLEGREEKGSFVGEWACGVGLSWLVRRYEEEGLVWGMGNGESGLWDVGVSWGRVRVGSWMDKRMVCLVNVWKNIRIWCRGLVPCCRGSIGYSNIRLAVGASAELYSYF